MTDLNPAADAAEEVVVAPVDAIVAETTVEAAPEEVAAPADAEVSTTEEAVAEVATEVVA